MLILEGTNICKKLINVTGTRITSQSIWQRTVRRNIFRNSLRIPILAGASGVSWEYSAITKRHAFNSFPICTVSFIRLRANRYALLINMYNSSPLTSKILYKWAKNIILHFLCLYYIIKRLALFRLWNDTQKILLLNRLG